jgi:hypothetical protein
MTMPPLPTWFRSREAITVFLAGWPLAGAPTRLVATRANGQPAFANYFWDSDRDAFVASNESMSAARSSRYVSRSLAAVHSAAAAASIG